MCTPIIPWAGAVLEFVPVLYMCMDWCNISDVCGSNHRIHSVGGCSTRVGWYYTCARIGIISCNISGVVGTIVYVVVIIIYLMTIIMYVIALRI